MKKKLENRRKKIKNFLSRDESTVLLYQQGGAVLFEGVTHLAPVPCPLILYL